MSIIQKIIQTVKDFFNWLLGRHRPLGYKRDITVKEGPLSIRIVGKPKDKDTIILYEMMQDVREYFPEYPIDVSLTKEVSGVGPYPKIYVDNQLHKTGMLTYTEIENLMVSCIKEKKKIVKNKIKELEELKKHYDYFLCYENPVYKAKTTEILVPAICISAREKNLRLDIRIKRDAEEGFKNTKPLAGSIYSRGQKIFDFRKQDGAIPEEIYEIGETVRHIY